MQQQQINPQLILISCTTFFLITILLTLSFIWIKFSRRQKTLTNNLNTKSTTIIPRDLSISYETISSGTYLESINISTNSNNYYHQISSSSSLYYDILPV